MAERVLTAAELEQRRAARTKHGAASETQIRPRARNHRRRVLRQLRLRPRDLDPIGLGYLDAYVRLQAKLDAIDAYVAEHGLIRGDGELQPCMKAYATFSNSARLALQRLESHLTDRIIVDEPLATIEAEGRRLRLAAEAGDE